MHIEEIFRRMRNTAGCNCSSGTHRCPTVNRTVSRQPAHRHGSHLHAGSKCRTETGSTCIYPYAHAQWYAYACILLSFSCTCSKTYMYLVYGMCVKPCIHNSCMSVLQQLHMFAGTVLTTAVLAFDLYRWQRYTSANHYVYTHLDICMF